MHVRKTYIAAAAFALASSGIAALQTASAAGMPGDQYHAAAASRVDAKQAVHNLETAAQRLRDAVQAMTDQPAGPKRDRAMHDANRALFDTNQAMLRLPEGYRYYGALKGMPGQPPAGQTFEQSMHELRVASDRLYNAVHAMARESGGQRLDQAIRDVNEALVETHGAMAWVYDQRLARSQARTGPMASGQAQGAASSHAGGTLRAPTDAASVDDDRSAIAGGVGINARARLSDQALPEHNVKMVFALDSGNYVADVHVKVMDKSGHPVIDGTAHGPWLYAKLPPGSYTATATYQGHSTTEHFSVGASGQRVALFRWPASVEQASAADVTPILGTGPEGR
jgi:hypothetical protein